MRWLNNRRNKSVVTGCWPPTFFFSRLLVLTENNLILNFNTYNELMFVLVIPPFLTLSSWKNCVPSFHRLRWTFRPRRNVSICGWRWCDSTLTAKPSSPDLFPASAVSRRVWYAFAFIKQHLEYCLWPNLLSRRLKVLALHSWVTSASWWPRTNWMNWIWSPGIF